MRNVWRSMINRCYVPTHPSWRWYGAKGITVCEQWRNSFNAFLNDVGVIPFRMTLDRIDSALGYEPGNIRLATFSEQSNNKSDNRPITIDNRTQNMTAWAKENNIGVAVACARIKRGWPPELAVTKPPMRGGSYLPNPRKTGWNKKRYEETVIST